MKDYLKKTLSILLVCAMLVALIPVVNTVKVHAVTQNQQRIVDRANYFFETTWVCQKTINGWRDEYIFEAGETYRLPYGQPVNSGKFIGYGVTLEDFLAAAADINSVYYSRQSEFNGWTSAYYATDCAAFVAMCWGTVRQDCSTLPYYSTNIGVVSRANLGKIQLGDALDSTSVGHVVLVTDLEYDDNGDLIHIEITEQTPPQLKRTIHTPETLLEKYADAFYIYRYYGEVPEAPVRGYTTDCESLAASCDIQITQDFTPIMSLPCESAVDEGSTQIGTAMSGDSYEAVRLYKNTEGQMWYRVDLPGSTDGYIRASQTSYQGQLLDDITLTDATAPSAHIRGRTFAVNGTIGGLNNSLTNASVYIYNGFGVSGTPVTGDTDVVSSNAYELENSTIDYNTSFGSIPTGRYTYVISVEYKNHYATGDTTYAVNTGTVRLMEAYFIVLNSSVNQNYCAHSYTTTVVNKQTCTQPGVTVKSCDTCGLVETIAVDADGHSYGEWRVDQEAQCLSDGQRSSVCSACGQTRTEPIPATGHTYTPSDVAGDCQTYPCTVYTCGSCGDSYNVYADELMSPWQSERPDADASLIQSKKQYRYRDSETLVSSQPSLEGYTVLDSGWTAGQSGTVPYVAQWPAGFDTTHSLYAQYNNIGSKVTASETETNKTVVDGESVVGYIYYHWCSDSDYNHYSYAQKSQSHNIFHAYYSTTNPDSYRCDTSDMSYKTSDSCCSSGNSEWFFVAKVTEQRYTTYDKTYTHQRWGEWSDWADEQVTASDVREVEERTVYRYVHGELGAHSYVDGVCTVCGHIDEVVPDVIPTITPAYPTVSFEGQIQMNIYFNASNLGNVGLEDMGLLTWSEHVNGGTIDNAKEVIPGAIYSGSLYYVHTNGIAAKNMCDTIYFKIYAKLSDGSYIYTDMFSTSPKNYAMSLLNNQSQSRETKALCVALLNYGAAAQKYFGYKTYDLINADLTQEHLSYVDSYSSSMMDDVVAADPAKTVNFPKNTAAFSLAYPSVSFEGAFSINYYFLNSYDIDDTMTLYYWSAEDYTKADVLSAENATWVREMDYDDVRYSLAVDNIAAKEMDSTVYVAAVYTCEEEICCTGVIAYSMGTYCEKIAGDGTSDAQELAALTAVYGYCAKVYFASIS